MWQSLSQFAPLPHTDTGDSMGGVGVRPPTEEVVLTGSKTSAGLVMAEALVLNQCVRTVTIKTISPDLTATEIAHFEQALARVKVHYDTLLKSSIGIPHLDEGMAVFVGFSGPDGFFAKSVRGKITEMNIDAQSAVHLVVKEFKGPTIQELYPDRAFEFDDFEAEVVRELTGQDCGSEGINAALSAHPGRKVLVASFLSPAQALQLKHHQVVGIAVNYDAPFSHLNMIVRDLGIPAVSHINPVADAGLRTGDIIAIDGETGVVTIRPSDATAAAIRARIDELDTSRIMVPLSEGASRTLDGELVKISGDLIQPDRVCDHRAMRIDGIGLMRTEMMLLGENRFLSLEEQTALYISVFRGMLPGPVTIRTFDLGYDKMNSGLGSVRNAQFGLRGIRYALQFAPKEFEIQLTAITMAATKVGGDVVILFPMLIDASDMKSAKAVYQKCVEKLMGNGTIKAPPRNIKLSGMIETPSAVGCINPILEHCDVVSVGSRDMLRYTLIGDETAAGVEYYHPAFLRNVRDTIRAANGVGKPVSICGDMVADASYAPLLIGLGARNITLLVGSVANVNAQIRRCDSVRCADLVQRIIDCGDTNLALRMHRDFLASLPRG